ncbi:transposase [bacterium]|nr:transposase [bacterium]
MPFSELFYHIIIKIETGEKLHPVTIKLIDTKIEEVISSIGGKQIAAKSLEDHVHLLVAMPPIAAPDDIVSEIKERTTELISGLGRDEKLEWAKGYGIVSVSNSHIELVTKYIATQEKRHAEGKINATLEKTET